MTEPYVIKMPQLSDTMTEGVVVSWEKAVGDKIERGDIVATVETDKAIMDVEVFREGFLSGPLAPVDATVPVGGAMAYLVDNKDQVVDSEAAPVVRAEESPAAGAARGTPAVPAVATPSVSVSGVVPAPRPQGRGATPYARGIAAQRDCRGGCTGCAASRWACRCRLPSGRCAW
jgi:dihydrolipoamide dehydrogenase